MHGHGRPRLSKRLVIPSKQLRMLNKTIGQGIANFLSARSTYTTALLLGLAIHILFCV